MRSRPMQFLRIVRTIGDYLKDSVYISRTGSALPPGDCQQTFTRVLDSRRMLTYLSYRYYGRRITDAPCVRTWTLKARRIRTPRVGRRENLSRIARNELETRPAEFQRISHEIETALRFIRASRNEWGKRRNEGSGRKAFVVGGSETKRESGASSVVEGGIDGWRKRSSRRGV